MGEFDLMSLAFLLDLGLYYFGIVSQPFKHGAAAFESRPSPSPSPLPSTPSWASTIAVSPRSPATAAKPEPSAG